MSLRNFRAPLRLPVRGKNDKYERNWFQLERTINAQTPICYGGTATLNAGAGLTGGTIYYPRWSVVPSPVQDRWQIINPTLLGGVSLDTDPPVVRVPWDGLWDLRITWVCIPTSLVHVRFSLDVGNYDDEGISYTFSALAGDSTTFGDSAYNVIYNSIFLGVPLKTNTLLRFGFQPSANVTGGNATIADQMFRWMAPYPNGEVMAVGQIPTGGGD